MRMVYKKMTDAPKNGMKFDTKIDICSNRNLPSVSMALTSAFLTKILIPKGVHIFE